MTIDSNQVGDSQKSIDAQAFLSGIDSDVERFEQGERQRLGIEGEATEQWRDLNPNRFTAAQREHTTILHAGLTMAHDLFIQSAFRGLGYKVDAMDVPDNRSLQFGREYGNRGQCNPTYFTVGNLVKKLKELHASGLSKKEIVEKYLFATAGSCGPCRFGSYVTEYRKALRDAGFDGFRVVLFQQTGGVKQATGEEMGLKIDLNFFSTITRAIILGDVLNAMMYRIRPYEIEKGATDTAIARVKARIAKAMETRKGMFKALWISRKELAAIKVDKTRVKPRVAIIGEFWAMTTEGDGNYKMQSFLEKEGAEVDIQLATNWGLYLLWAAKYDTLDRAKLRGTDKQIDEQNGGIGSKFALEGVDVAKKLWMIKAGAWFMRGYFYGFAKLLGLRDYKLPDMEHIAEISHAFYDNNLRGGEGHMEVGKLIHNVVDQKVNMTLSIKPFGCMPSSSVSDGVQSLITELYPASIFLPIETNGDGAVNVYSRVQMQLFKARQAAEKEVKTLAEKHGWDLASFEQKYLSNGKVNAASYRSPHAGGCTAIDVLQDLIKRDRFWMSRAWSKIKGAYYLRSNQHRKNILAAVRQASEKSKEGSTFSGDMAVKIIEP